MQQYLDIKQDYPDAFLLFRMGDFYELFYDDAVKAAQILELTLTSRNKNADNPIPMAGVPHHSVQQYIDILIDLGYKVAIAEQMEDPKKLSAWSNAMSCKSLHQGQLLMPSTPARRIISSSLLIGIKQATPSVTWTWQRGVLCHITF